MSNENKLLQAALKYYQRGWLAVPQNRKSRKPCEPYKELLETAKIDERRISYWFRKHPKANLALITGECSSFVVLDIDGKEGYQSLEKLEKQYGKLPVTYNTGTPHGEHRYFEYPSILIRCGAIPNYPGLEIKTNNTLITAPPSLGYEVIDSVKLASMPRGLIKLATVKPDRVTKSTTYIKGERNDALIRETGRLRDLGLEVDEIYPVLLSFNKRHCKPSLSDREVWNVAQKSGKWKKGFSDNGIYDEGAELKIVEATDVKTKPILWLWPDKIPRESLTLIAGPPEAGKSIVTSDFVARVTSGSKWPDKMACPKGDVLYFVSGEEDTERILQPRLKEMGANCKRLHYVSGIITKEGNNWYFDIAKNLPALEQGLKKYEGTRLVVFDPIIHFIHRKGKVDEYKEIYANLMPLVNTISKYDIAVIGVTHTPKRDVRLNPLYSSPIGSQGWTAVARSIWMVVKDPTDLERRLFINFKSSYSSRLFSSNRAFTIEQTGDGNAEVVVNWEKEELESIEEIFIESNRGIGRPPVKTNQAKEVILQTLKEGPRSVEDMRELANSIVMSWRQFQNAKKELGIKSYAENGSWFWRLPDVKP